MTAPTQVRQPPAGTGVSAGQVAVYALGAAAVARAAQLAVRAALMRDVIRMWPLLDKKRLDETFPGWLGAMQALVTSYHGQSAQAAATFYRAARSAALQSPTPLELIQTPPAPPSEWTARAFGFSGPGMMSKDTARPGTALSTTLGTASRIALDGGRSTISDTVKKDPAAVGWYFHTDGDPCWWCAMIASRGVIFKEHSLDRSNARFVGEGTAKVHNHCGCILAPAFSRRQQLPDVNDAAEQVWRENAAQHSGDKARQAFRDAWEKRQSAS